MRITRYDWLPFAQTGVKTLAVMYCVHIIVKAIEQSSNLYPMVVIRLGPFGRHLWGKWPKAWTEKVHPPVVLPHSSGWPKKCCQHATSMRLSMQPGSCPVQLEAMHPRADHLSPLYDRSFRCRLITANV